MSQRAIHWENVYQTKQDADTSWYQAEPKISLDLIGSVAPKQARVIDIGGGASALAGRLVDSGFQVSVLDISAAAIERAKARIGEPASKKIRWIVADVTEIDEVGTFDIWHDRAVLHFLVEEEDRRKYSALAAKTVVPGGHLIVGTFALDGPEKCSGLPVLRYDDRNMTELFAPDFKIVRTVRDTHVTPWGKPQAFFFAVLQRG